MSLCTRLSCGLRAIVVVMVVVVVGGVRSSPPQSPPQDQPTSTPTTFLVSLPCEDVQPLSDFNATAFSGRWYKFGGLPNEQEITDNCTVYDYKYTGSGYEVTESGVDETGAKVSQTNVLTQPLEGVGDFVASVDGLEAHLQVLTTDYTTLACLYTCHTVRDTHRVHLAWILSRDTTLPRRKIAECQVRLKEVNVPLLKLEKISHGSGC